MCVSVSLLNNIGVPHEASICFGPSLFYEGLPQVEPGVFGRQRIYRGCRTEDRPQMGMCVHRCQHQHQSGRRSGVVRSELQCEDAADCGISKNEDGLASGKTTG